MLKKIIIVIVIVVVLLGAWYLISPLWRDIVRNEASPLDNLEGMSTEERAEFDAAVEEASKTVMGMTDKMPEGPNIIATSPFMAAAHEVSGKALLIETEDGKILRFEDFETINGPNLHIYLSTDLGSDDFIDLGKIKATKGNVNYEIPETIDTTSYNKVLVWCVPFGVLFSYAEL